VAGELSAVVGCDGLDDVLERLEKMYHRFSQSLGILALVEFSHEEHVCASLNDCDNGAMVVFADNGVYLEISEALLRPLFRLSSRDMVDGLTFMVAAMSFFFIPCWSMIEIVYLCSEVICLYISNTKLSNLGETAVSLFCFFVSLSERLRCMGVPAPNPPGVFSYSLLRPVSDTKNCSSILNLRPGFSGPSRCIKRTEEMGAPAKPCVCFSIRQARFTLSFLTFASSR
jgi:hypothetical protein